MLTPERSSLTTVRSSGGEHSSLNNEADRCSYLECWEGEAIPHICDDTSRLYEISWSAGSAHFITIRKLDTLSTAEDGMRAL